MGFRYRRTWKVLPGTRVTLAKSGIGFSVGSKRVRMTKHAGGGVSRSINLPVKGLSHHKTIRTKSGNKPGQAPARQSYERGGNENHVVRSPAAPPNYASVDLGRVLTTGDLASAEIAYRQAPADPLAVTVFALLADWARMPYAGAMLQNAVRFGTAVEASASRPGFPDPPIPVVVSRYLDVNLPLSEGSLPLVYGEYALNLPEYASSALDVLQDHSRNSPFLTEAHLILGAELSLVLGEPSAAIDWLELVDDDTDATFAARMIAAEAAVSGNTPDAVERTQQALAVAHGEHRKYALELRAWANLHSGRPRAARRDLEMLQRSEYDGSRCVRLAAAIGQNS
ncbi:MAG: DUF4236 domain-containing protein [Gordonia sp. (in: high G+C Gram-positive bacteria)]|uniref:DUF4236 domain-containing protein n=1 Tax=Gordonia sp. (in: high G+C Gram-positive bacteria) TaxID=84139 RepID=UPI0039E70B5B